MPTLLTVDELKVWFDTPEGVVRAVDGVSLEVEAGQTVALLGESGSGKSITALALLQLVPQPTGRIVAGKVLLDGRDLMRFSERDMRQVRGKRIAMIFQEPQTSLNPVLTLEQQIGEVLPRSSSRRARRERIAELLDAVGMSDPGRRLGEYPHQLSGGMKQRAMIAMALAAEPQLLIADEPTTALDVTIQAQVLDLLKDLQRRTGMAVLFITHDLGVVHQVADRVAVMYAGQIVESAGRRDFFGAARHPYSHKLFRSVPSRNKRGGALEVIAGAVPSLAQEFHGCRFAERCDWAWEQCRTTLPEWQPEGDHGVRCHLYTAVGRGRPGPAGMTAEAAMQTREAGHTPTPPVLQVKDLAVHFPIRRGVLQRVAGYVRAVDGVSLTVGAARTLALVGESGCGKTTVGKAILQLIAPTAGEVEFDGMRLDRLTPAALRPLRRRLQIVFQDPFASLDPRMLVGQILEEGMRAQGIGGADSAARRRRVRELLQQVGLSADVLNRYPHEFSGGQRQRLCIARALSVEPQLIICDEPTSALDVSVQAQILNLLKRLQQELALSYLFITHNLAVVEYLAHEVAVMYLGRIVEQGSVGDVLDSPRHPYTQALLAAVPTFTVGKPGETGVARPVVRLQGDVPSPAKPPSGCHYHPRCPQAMDRCRTDYPAEAVFSATHKVRCHLYPAGSR